MSATTNPSRRMVHHGLHFAVGFLSRPCCSIPALLALLGAGGAGVAAALAPWRPWFLAGALVFFIVSFYINFIKNHNRVGMVVWVASAVIAGTIWVLPMLNTIAAEPASRVIPMNNAQSSTAVLDVRGMACGACAKRVTRALEATDGVSAVSVTVEPGTATVEYDSTRVAPSTLIEQVQGLGFLASLRE